MSKPNAYPKLALARETIKVLNIRTRLRTGVGPGHATDGPTMGCSTSAAACASAGASASDASNGGGGGSKPPSHWAECGDTKMAALCGGSTGHLTTGLP